MSLRYDAMLHQWKNTVRFGEKPNLVGTWYFTSAHNCNTILNINHLSRTRSIASLPCKIVWEIWYDLLPRNHFFIRGFSPWNGERFLFLIPFTIRQHCIIYPQEFSTGPKKSVEVEWGVGAKKKGQSHDFPISLNTQLSIKQLFWTMFKKICSRGVTPLTGQIYALFVFCLQPNPRLLCSFLTVP